MLKEGNKTGIGEEGREKKSGQTKKEREGMNGFV